MSENPFFSAPRGQPINFIPDKVASLPLDVKALFMSLTSGKDATQETKWKVSYETMDARGFPNKSGLSVEERVHIFRLFESNAFDDCDRGVDMCVYAEASRINHSCLPNVTHDYNNSIQRGTITTVKDVAAGEELFVSYTCATDDYKERVRRCTKYGFRCECKACDLSTQFGRESNVRRQRMKVLGNKMDSFFETPYSFGPSARRVAIREALEFEKLVEEEGLFEGLHDA